MTFCICEQCSRFLLVPKPIRRRLTDNYLPGRRWRHAPLTSFPTFFVGGGDARASAKEGKERSGSPPCPAGRQFASLSCCRLSLTKWLDAWIDDEGGGVPQARRPMTTTCRRRRILGGVCLTATVSPQCRAGDRERKQQRQRFVM
jgi:hypothetical protein